MALIALIVSIIALLVSLSVLYLNFLYYDINTEGKLGKKLLTKKQLIITRLVFPLLLIIPLKTKFLNWQIMNWGSESLTKYQIKYIDKHRDK